MVKRDLRTKSKSIHSAITITIAHSDKSRSAMRKEPRGNSDTPGLLTTNQKRVFQERIYSQKK